MPDATEDSEYNFTILVEDVDSESLIISAQYLPSWLVLDNNMLIGTPISFIEDITEELTLSVSDSDGATTTNNFSLLVLAINNNPEAYSQSAFTLEDNSIELFFTGYDSDGDALTFVIEDSPDYGSITMNDTGESAVYIPNENYAGNSYYILKCY